MVTSAERAVEDEAAGRVRKGDGGLARGSLQPLVVYKTVNPALTLIASGR